MTPSEMIQKIQTVAEATDISNIPNQLSDIGRLVMFNTTEGKWNAELRIEIGSGTISFDYWTLKGETWQQAIIGLVAKLELWV